MAGKMAGKAANKYLTGRAEQMAPADPVYESYMDAQGREQRRKRAMPAGLTSKEEKLLKKIRKRARRLDRGMSLCGFRVGWTFWLGLIPGLGDIVDFLLSYFLVIKPATKGEDVPGSLRAKMISNQTVAFACGLVPLAGDVVMAMWRSNSRNASLFEKYLTEMAAARMRQQQQQQQQGGGVDNREQAAQKTLAASKKWKWSRMSGVVDNDGAFAPAGQTTTVDGSAMNRV